TSFAPGSTELAAEVAQVDPVGPDEGLRDGEPELLGDLGLQLEARERVGEGRVVADRHAGGPGLLDDAAGDLPAARGDDLRRAGAVVAQRGRAPLGVRP